MSSDAAFERAPFSTAVEPRPLAPPAAAGASEGDTVLELDDAAAYAELLAEDDGASPQAGAGGGAQATGDITALRLLLRDQETLEGALRMFV